MYYPYSAQESLQDMATGSKPDSDIIDIDLNDPEVEKAAFKIQAGFRGHLAKKSVKSIHSIDLSKSDEEKNWKSTEKTKNERQKKPT